MASHSAQIDGTFSPPLVLFGMSSVVNEVVKQGYSSLIMVWIHTSSNRFFFRGQNHEAMGQDVQF